MKYIKYLILILFYLSNVSFHPFHLSVTEVKYNNQSHTVEVSCRMFINDLESILKKNYGVAFDLYKQHENTEVYHTLSKYIQKNLTVQIASKNIPFTLLGSEREDDALWIYLESAVVPMPQQVDIKNTLLFDLFNDQANIIHFELNGQKKSHKLVNPEEKVTFK